MPKRALFIGLLLFATSCGDSEWPDVIGGPFPRGSQVQTDSAQYQMTPVTGGISESVHVTYTNILQGPVYYERCTRGDNNPMYDVVRAGPDSVTPLELGYVWACVGGVPTGVINPGATVSFDVDLTTFDDAGHPVPVADRSGSMKIVLRLCSRYRSESSDCESIDLGYQTSNLFTLVPPSPASPSR